MIQHTDKRIFYIKPFCAKKCIYTTGNEKKHNHKINNVCSCKPESYKSMPYLLIMTCSTIDGDIEYSKQKEPIDSPQKIYTFWFIYLICKTITICFDSILCEILVILNFWKIQFLYNRGEVIFECIVFHTDIVYSHYFIVNIVIIQITTVKIPLEVRGILYSLIIPLFLYLFPLLQLELEAVS